ncbi:bifunctional 2',3'-cyclic-nucleotide 2'-phosphodiesterase/3'-nucleotidase [Pseudidiomarina homiensis]|uniref:Bifunctional 2',3'-cyclic-nucleotide 2'-phosphodiesterase/3'-nucleotidase n=2 Tax=Pseudidiomarina homiensis TaxID=364198 RepID=A0A432Y421_9GAMM|nr:bifunctional 2',3'-cyclic-nucleotide 2'-phosphodiesterase/3'-nucleotidase [Pseudidiomarina homiensis]
MLRTFSYRLLASILVLNASFSNVVHTMPTANHHQITLRIMTTSDVHGQMLNYDYYSSSEVAEQGLVKTATLISQARQEQPFNLLIENGDLIQGSAFADYAVAEFPVTKATHPIIQALNYLQYDVANLGNHEFNFGLDYLAATYRDSNFPVVASNLELLPSAPAALREKLVKIAWIQRSVPQPGEGPSIPLTIAVIGVMPPQIMQWDQHHLNEKVNVAAMLTATEERVQRARAEGADVVILAAHTGMPKSTDNPDDSEQTGWLLAGVPGIDALLLGHQHEVFPGTSVYNRLSGVDSENGRVRGVPAVQPGIYGSHLGIVDLELHYGQKTGWQVTTARSEARAVEPSTAIDSKLAERLQSAHDATLAFMQQPIGSTTQPLSYKTARWQPSSAVQFVQRAQLWQARQLITASAVEELPLLSAAAPFDAAFSSSDSATEISAGPLTRGAIGDLYRYPNTLDIVKLNGAQIKDWLEQSAAAFVAASESSPLLDCWRYLNSEVAHYNFDTLLGLDYHIDITAEPGQRIKDVRYAGKTVSNTDRFYVATNNYRANGGGDFPHLDGEATILRGADMLSDVLLNYLGSLPQGVYSEELQLHWQVIGCGGRI